jgi:hypothetical protein
MPMPVRAPIRSSHDATLPGTSADDSQLSGFDERFDCAPRVVKLPTLQCPESWDAIVEIAPRCRAIHPTEDPSRLHRGESPRVSDGKFRDLVETRGNGIR